MMKPDSDFDVLLDRCTQQVTPQQRATVRRRLQKSTAGLGSSPEEVLRQLLESVDDTAINGNGNGSGVAIVAIAIPSDDVRKTGTFRKLLVRLGLLSL